MIGDDPRKRMPYEIVWFLLQMYIFLVRTLPLIPGLFSDIYACRCCNAEHLWSLLIFSIMFLPYVLTLADSESGLKFAQPSISLHPAPWSDQAGILESFIR